MDFFQHQQQARVNTRKLVLYLFLAIVSLLAITHTIFFFVFSFGMYSPRNVQRAGHFAQDPVTYVNSGTFWFITIAILLIVIFATIYKWLSLRAGGAVIAEHLGGTLISNATGDFHEKRLLNVVQEMALASGSPVPPVYVLEENAINAFAAGHSTADAVIGITRGAITRLNRDQLQGVIAHEFSHIFNGDARLNLNLIAILHGILVIGLLGYFALRGARHASGRSAGLVVGIGFGLVVLGYGGTFFGNLIKAAISRQREFLADAAAVQFTRNPDGLAGALQVIGGTTGSLMDNSRVDEITHLLFAEGKHFAGWWATHPPLDVRIKRINPHWDGKYITTTVQTPAEDNGTAKAAAPQRSEEMIAAVAVLASINHIGTIDNEHLGYTRQLLQQMPAALINISRTPGGAASILLALVLSQQTTPREKLDAHADQIKLLVDLPERMRLPLIDLCIASLKQGNAEFADSFSKQLAEVIRLDNKTSLFEWCLDRIINHQLQAFFRRPARADKLLRISDCGKELSVVLSLLTQLDSRQEPALLVTEVAGKFRLRDVNYLPPEQISPGAFAQAVDHLQSLRPMDKPIAIKACAHVITHDEVVNVKEVELLRALSASWDCPMPPIIVS